MWSEPTGPRESCGQSSSEPRGASGPPFPSACASHAMVPPRIQMKDVVTMARMVPVGIDF